MQSGNVLSNYLALPDEALFQILSNSLPEDINAARRLNRRLRNIATDNRLWKTKFKIHFPHLFDELNKIPDINWYAEFANTYRQEYTTVLEDKNEASFLPLRIRRQFALVKEGRTSELERDLVFADLRYKDANKNIVDWAIKNNDQTALDAIFKVVLNEYTHDSEIDVNKTDSFNWNILHWAVHCRQSYKVINLLLRKGVDINAVTTSGITALLLAIAIDCPDIVRHLIDKGYPINTKHEFGKPPKQIILTGLIYAIVQKKKESVDVLLEKGANANLRVEGDAVPFNDGMTSFDTPLLVAVKSGEIEVVKALLDRGASINFTDRDGYTPLIIAAALGEVDIVRLLISRGAEINRSGNAHHITALMYAVLRGHKNVVDVLVQNNADRNIILGDDIRYQNTSFSTGCKTIHIAIKLGYVDIAKALLIDSEDVNSPGNSNNTPLMTAILYGLTEMVEHLVNCNVNINSQATSGATALIYAITKRRDDVVDLLLSRKANVGLSCTQNLGKIEGIEVVAGDTPLHIAAKFGNEGLVEKLLLANESIVEVRNSKGQTPADVARPNSKLRDMLNLLKYSLEINRLEDNTHKKSFTLFGHEFNFGVSVGEKKAAVSEFLRLYRSGGVDESILERHAAALNNGELGGIARNILGK